MTADTAFVTGATGFLGSQLCGQLRAAGWAVTALVRTPARATQLAQSGVACVPGDILDPASLATGMPRSVDAVFHVAGDTSLWSKRDATQTRINVEGTSNVLAAARAAGARRFLLTSSVSAYGPQDGVITEATPSNAMRSPLNYDRSKWLGEEEVRKAMAQGMDAVILQPAAIIGPGDASNWGRMFVMAEQGKLGFLPSGGLPFNHVREVVRGHMAAAERGRPGESYLLGGDYMALADLAREVFRLLGRKAPGWTAPPGLLRRLGTVVGALTPASVRGEPLMTREVAEFMSAVTRCDSSKAERELGLRPTPLAECLADCHRWLVQQKLL